MLPRRSNPASWVAASQKVLSILSVAKRPWFPPRRHCQESARRSGQQAQDVGPGPRTMRLHAASAQRRSDRERPPRLPQPCVPRGCQCGSRDEHSRALSAAELRSGLPAAGAEVARDLRLAGLPPAGRLGRCDHRREECLRSLPHRRAVAAAAAAAAAAATAAAAAAVEK